MSRLNDIKPPINERQIRKAQLENAIKSESYSLAPKVQPPNNKKTSAVYWELIYEIYDDNDNLVLDYVACNKCKQAFYYRSIDGNAPLKRHYDSHTQSAQHNTLDNFVQKPTKKFSCFDRENAKSAATDFVVKDIRPFEALTGNGLIALLMFFTQIGHRHGPLSHDDIVELLPSPQTISRHIAKIGEEVKKNIKEELSSCLKGGISMTTDLWTDNYRRVSYLCITAHYFVELGAKMVYRNRITCLRPMDSRKRKTHDVLLKIIDEEIDKLGLNEHRHLITFVTDRGSNIVKALKNQYKRINCQAHFLENLVKKFYTGKNASKILDIVKPIVRYVKINGYNEQFPIGKKIKSFSKTRWNSAYDMLHSILKSWEQLEKLLKDNKSNHFEKFKSLNKRQIEEMCDFLKQFKDYTNQLEGSKVNIFNVLPCIMKIKNILVLTSVDSQVVKEMKKKCIEYFNKRNKLEHIYYLSAMLYPPLNTLRPYNEEIRSNGIRYLRAKFDELKPTTVEPTETTTKTSYSLIAEAAANGDNRDELERYMALSVPVTKNFDVMEWWNMHKQEFPILYSMVLSIYSIPASSAPSERAFSYAGNIVTNKRSNLEPSKLENVLVLNRNADLIPNKKTHMS